MVVFMYFKSLSEILLRNQGEFVGMRDFVKWMLVLAWTENGKPCLHKITSLFILLDVMLFKVGFDFCGGGFALFGGQRGFQLGFEFAELLIVAGT